MGKGRSAKEQFKTNDRTISAYIKYLCNAFAFYKVRRYDIQGKRYLASNDKYYLSDHSFKYACLGTKNADYGRLAARMINHRQRKSTHSFVDALFFMILDISSAWRV